MIYKYTKKKIDIKSDWFEEEPNNKFKKIGSEGLNLYFTLFKFRVARQESEIFITSISLLRKESGYTTEKVFELLKILKENKIIKMSNLSKWIYLLEDKQIKVDKILEIEAIDCPITDEDQLKKYNDEFHKDQPETKKKKELDFFIKVDLDLLELYKEDGLNERYYPLYCLIRKMSNNSERKSFMATDTMASILGYGKDTIAKMIKVMNEKKFLKSKLINNGKGKSKFEHYICFGTSIDKRGYNELDIFRNNHFNQVLFKPVIKKKNEPKEVVEPEDDYDLEDDG